MPRSATPRTSPSGPERPDGFVQVATLGKTFGLDGGLRIYALGAAEAGALDAIAAAQASVFVEDDRLRQVRDVRAHGSDTLVFLAGVGSVEAAKALRNARVWADPDDLPAAPDGRAYLDAVLDAEVFLARDADSGPTSIGRVEEVWPGAQDLLHVRLADGGGRRMIPLQAPYVRLDGEADGGCRVVLTDPPAGLLDA